MKKNIDFVNLDPSLLHWLLEKLTAAPAELRGTDDLLRALRGLAEENSSSLMLELEKEASGTRPGAYGDRLQCGDLVIYMRARRVLRDGSEIFLTPKEFDILAFLARNRGEVFTKEQIYTAVWANEYLLDDSNIMAFIRKLRKKIEPCPDDPKYILTIWGIGYKFNDTL